MSGQLLRAKTAREKAPKHTHVVITFTQGGLLRFVDPRTFGEMFVTEYDEIDEQVEELAHLGLDPLETAMSWDLFGRMLAERKTQAEDAADGSEVHRRHRQRLQRRDPVRGRPQVGPHERLALAAGGPPPVPRDLRDVAGRGEVPRLVARRRAVRRPVRPARRVPAAPPGVRPRGPGVPAVPAPDRARPASRTARPSSARRVRSDDCQSRSARRRDRPGAGRVVPRLVPRPARRGRARARVGAQPRRRLGRGRVRGRRGRGRPHGRLVPDRAAAGASTASRSSGSPRSASPASGSVEPCLPSR